MKKEHLEEFNNNIGVDPVLINSELYTAHYRQRYYWISSNKLILNPTYKAPVLQDIIVNAYADRNKSYCIDANYWKKGNITQYLRKSRRQIVYLRDDHDLFSTEEKINTFKLNVDYRHLTVDEVCLLQKVTVEVSKLNPPIGGDVEEVTIIMEEIRK